MQRVYTNHFSHIKITKQCIKVDKNMVHTFGGGLQAEQNLPQSAMRPFHL